MIYRHKLQFDTVWIISNAKITTEGPPDLGKIIGKIESTQSRWISAKLLFIIERRPGSTKRKKSNYTQKTKKQL